MFECASDGVGKQLRGDRLDELILSAEDDVPQAAQPVHLGAVDQRARRVDRDAGVERRAPPLVVLKRPIAS